MYSNFDFVRRLVPETSTAFVTPVVVFPLSGAAIDLWFETSQYYDAGTIAVTDVLSCSRASIGYGKTSAGALTQFASNVLRITDLGLLIEPAQTNYAIQSQTMDNGSWIKTNLTVVQDAASAPDGTTTADKIYPTGVGVVSCFNNAGNTLTAAKWTWSCFFKADGYNWGSLMALTGGNLVRQTIVVRLSDGVVTATSTLGSPTGVTYGTESYGNGWWRAWITMDADATIGSIDIALSDADTPTVGFTNAAPNIGNNGTDGVYVWGAQIEEGSILSSYIPTTTSSAARAADVITNTGDLQTTIAAATGSAVAQVDNGRLAGAAANIVDSNGTNLLGFDASNHALASITATLATGNTANRTTQDKLGLAWDASGRSLVLNGGTVATDATAQTPSATQHLGSDGSANFIYAYIERLTVWTSKLADATLQGHT